MAVTAVVFDLGETLADETRQFEETADALGVPRFTFMALAGAAIARGEQPDRGGYRAAPFTEADLYADALPCLRALRGRGTTVGAVGNMDASNEAFIAPHVDFVGSSQRWGVAKPEPAFFARIADELGRPPAEIVYVGDRVDNDVAPALAFGMAAVHVRRGPWGHLHETPAGVRRVDSLLELLG
jgi:HAD superfamily hydrolase (TIGR01509 family)